MKPPSFAELAAQVEGKATDLSDAEVRQYLASKGITVIDLSDLDRGSRRRELSILILTREAARTERDRIQKAEGRGHWGGSFDEWEGRGEQAGRRTGADGCRVWKRQCWKSSGSGVPAQDGSTQTEKA